MVVVVYVVLVVVAMVVWWWLLFIVVVAAVVDFVSLNGCGGWTLEGEWGREGGGNDLRKEGRRWHSFVRTH